MNGQPSRIVPNRRSAPLKVGRKPSPWKFWDTLSLMLVVSGCLDIMAGLLLLVISPTVGWFQGLILTVIGLASYCLGRLGVWLTFRNQPLKVAVPRAATQTMFLVTGPSRNLYPVVPSGSFQQFAENLPQNVPQNVKDPLV